MPRIIGRARGSRRAASAEDPVRAPRELLLDLSDLLRVELEGLRLARLRVRLRDEPAIPLLRFMQEQAPRIIVDKVEVGHRQRLLRIRLRLRLLRRRRRGGRGHRLDHFLHLPSQLEGRQTALGRLEVVSGAEEALGEEELHLRGVRRGGEELERPPVRARGAIEAVRAMVAALGLAERVELRWERVERSGRSPDCRGGFGLAIARAVAAAPVVAEYLVPLLRPDGEALLYRGQWGPVDQESLERAAGPLRAAVASVEAIELPGGRGMRHAVRLVPRGPCPTAYPRAVGVALKAPLGGELPQRTGEPARLSRPADAAAPRRRGGPAADAGDRG